MHVQAAFGSTADQRSQQSWHGGSPSAHCTLHRWPRPCQQSRAPPRACPQRPTHQWRTRPFVTKGSCLTNRRTCGAAAGAAGQVGETLQHTGVDAGPGLPSVPLPLLYAAARALLPAPAHCGSTASQPVVCRDAGAASPPLRRRPARSACHCRGEPRGRGGAAGSAREGAQRAQQQRGAAKPWQALSLGCAAAGVPVNRAAHRAPQEQLAGIGLQIRGQAGSSGNCSACKRAAGAAGASTAGHAAGVAGALPEPSQRPVPVPVPGRRKEHSGAPVGIDSMAGTPAPLTAARHARRWSCRQGSLLASSSASWCVYS